MNEEDILKLIRKNMPDAIADEISSVQPMKDNVFKDIYDNAMSEEELKKEGYEPVSGLGLMWIKKEDTK